MWNETLEEDPFDLVDDNSGNLYHSDENTGVMTTGWYRLKNTTSRYPNKDSIWMYFNPSNFRATRSTGNNYKGLTLGNKNYAFDDKGVMLTGFEASKYNEEHGGTIKNVYFGSDGAEVKNSFYLVDLSDDENYEKYEYYDDYDDITIYLSKNGQVYSDTIKKIGSSYYGFDHNGVVVKGLSVWNSGQYIATIDTESTNGKSFINSGIYSIKNGGHGTLSSNDTLHYFSEGSGKRLTSGKLEFSDFYYNYEGNNSGAFEGSHNKKYYVHGILMKPEEGVRYGVYIANPTKSNYTMTDLSNADNLVINSSGSIISYNSIIKDENDNYWLISGRGLKNVYTVNIRENGNTYYFRSTNTNGKDDWIKFGEKDIYGKTCTLEVLANGTRLSNGAISSYQSKIPSDAAINFSIK